MDNLVKSESRFSFSLDGENEIDAAVLSKTIGDFAELTKFAASQENPEAYLKLNVTAFKNGSFQVNFSAVSEIVETIVDNKEAILAFTGVVVGVVTGYFQIKKHIKGKPPRDTRDISNSQVEIENQDGDTIIVPNASQAVINNIHIDHLVSNVSHYAHEHNPQGGFTIQTESGELRCDPADIVEMARSAQITEYEVRAHYHEKVILPIRKPVLVGASKWGVEYKGHAVEAAITDTDFLDGFQSGGTVGPGDCIQADIETDVALDQNNAPIKGTEKYTITQVYGGIMRKYGNVSQSTIE